MKPRKIFIVRHGETDFNRQNIVQGSGVDSSINALGRLQAEHFFIHYQDYPFEKIYISNLRRTAESVNAFIEKGIPFEALSGLNEISWGVYEGLAHTAQFEQDYHNRVADWRTGKLDIPVEGGETPLELHERQKVALAHILSGPEQNILICMHGRALKAFICLLQQISLSHMDDYDHRNLGLYIFEEENGQFKMTGRNLADHLDGIPTVTDFT
jgi:probable phosphoglycerate mutase